jgi:arsenite methyltransferase
VVTESPAPPLEDDELVAVFDELPLWSAPFGLRLLEQVRLRRGIVALDVGCGTGFPLVELAQRLGATAHVHGVDPWAAALARVRRKLAFSGVSNVTLHEGKVEDLTLPGAAVDLIVSNNGLNNVADLDAALAACARVAAPGAQLVYTYNLPSSMSELYDTYDELLSERGLDEARTALRAHIFAKRKPLEFTVAALERAGFRIVNIVEDSFRWHFLDGATLFAHSFVRLAFLDSWRAIVPIEQRAELIESLAEALTARAGAGPVTLTIPFVCIDAERSGRAELPG